MFSKVVVNAILLGMVSGVVKLTLLSMLIFGTLSFFTICYCAPSGIPLGMLQGIVTGLIMFIVNRQLEFDRDEINRYRIIMAVVLVPSTAVLTGAIAYLALSIYSATGEANLDIVLGAMGLSTVATIGHIQILSNWYFQEYEQIIH